MIINQIDDFFSTACRTGLRTLPAAPGIKVMSDDSFRYQLLPSPSAPEVSGAAVDDSAMEVCGNLAGSGNLGTCSGRRTSASSSALKYFI